MVFKKSEAFNSRVSMFRYGVGGVTTTYAELLDNEGDELSAVEFKQNVRVRIHIESSIDGVLGACYYIMDDKKNLILGAGPRQLDVPFIEVKAGLRYIVTYKTNLPLQEGNYSIQIQLNRPLQEGMSAEYLDVIDDAIVFKMLQKDPVRIWTKVYIDNEMDVVGI